MTIQAGMLPELQIGVETPWPIKREGKQVYAKLIDFGPFPAPYGGKSKTHDVQNIDWKQISWDHSSISKSTDGALMNLGLVSTPSLLNNQMPWRFAIDRNSIQCSMMTATDYREWDTILLCILYTKTADDTVSGELVTPGPDGQVLTSRDNELVWEEASGGQAGVPQERRINTAAPLTGGGELSQDLNLGINATSAATSNSVIQRDGAGRAQVAAPAAAADIVNKAYVDAKVPVSGAAPIPGASTGVGQFIFINNVDVTSYSLPAGGTWAYYLTYSLKIKNGSYDAYIPHSAGVARGGTQILPPAPYFTFRLGGFAWRIS